MRPRSKMSKKDDQEKTNRALASNLVTTFGVVASASLQLFLPGYKVALGERYLFFEEIYRFADIPDRWCHLTSNIFGMMCCGVLLTVTVHEVVGPQI